MSKKATKKTAKKTAKKGECCQLVEELVAATKQLLAKPVRGTSKLRARQAVAAIEAARAAEKD